MAYPAGVQTVTLRLGSSFDSAGTLASISGHVVPMFGAGADHLVWADTGQTYAKVRTNLAWDDTEKVALATVPHPTQAGWRDQTQATFSGWSYQISAVAVYASGERQSFERTITPQPGDTVIDVDLLPNGAAATPTVVAEWEAARADALAALAVSGSAVQKPQRATVALSTLPTQLNTQRRYIQSAYSQDNIVTLPDGTQYAVIVGSDLHAWVCKRSVDSDRWEKFDLTTIPGNPFGTQVDDSHATWQLGVDSAGHILVCGNNHSTPSLTAYTTNPGDITGWTMIPAGTAQDLVTYEKFVTLPDGTLMRFWRNGYATSGDEYFHTWNPATKAFSAAVKLLDGTASAEGAYTWRIAARGDLIAVFYSWRGSGDASTNTDLCYMESADGGTSWRTIDGTPLTLPVTHAGSDIIRPIAAGSGFINQGGADIDPQGRPHVAYLIEDDTHTATQVAHTYWTGTAWVHDQVTDWSHLIETIGKTTLLLDVARPQIICTNDGTYVITRTSGENLHSRPVMIDVSPGASRAPFLLADLDLFHWEPSLDYRALRERGELHMLITPTDPVKDSKLGFVAQWGGVLSVQLNQVRALQGGFAKIPTIAVDRRWSYGAQLGPLGTATEANYIGTTAYVSATSGGATDVSRMLGMGVPALPVLDEYTRKGAILFARQALRFNNAGAGNGVLRLRESPDVGALPTADVAQIYFVDNSGIRATPWTPLQRTPFIEADGKVRSTRLIPRIMHTTGVTIDSWVIEVGYLSWT